MQTDPRQEHRQPDDDRRAWLERDEALEFLCQAETADGPALEWVLGRMRKWQERR